MNIRLIQPEEWSALQPVFAAEGGRMPDPARATAAVAFDERGLAGFWTLQLLWHAGPLWVREDLRGTGLWAKLHARIDSLFARELGAGYYSFSGEPKMEAIFARLGYRDLGYKAWAREAA